MARAVTIGTVINRARILADMRHSNFISSEDALEFANIVYPEFYDTLVSSFQNYFVTEDFINIVSGTSSYDVPEDFYKVISLDMDQGGGAYSTIYVYNENEKNSILGSSPATIPTGRVRIRYIPAPTVFTSVDDEIDGVSGWDVLLTYDLAIMFLTAEESDTSALERKRQAHFQRITSMAQNRDVSQPGRITDTTVFDNPLNGDQLRYRFYGDQIEFLNVTYIGI